MRTLTPSRASTRTFGDLVALSEDANTLAIAAGSDASCSATGSTTVDTKCNSAGAVYVFARDATSDWKEQAFLKADMPTMGTVFGDSIAISADGDMLAVGSPREGGGAGAAYLYTRSAGAWSKQVRLPAPSGIGGLREYGFSIALSGDGQTLAVGARAEAGCAVTIDGAQVGDCPGAGAVFVYKQNGGNWAQEAYVKSTQAMPPLSFGYSLAISDDGNVLVVGSMRVDDKGSTAHVFRREGGRWQPGQRLDPESASPEEHFGQQVAVSGDGSRVAVAAPGDSSCTQGVDADAADTSCPSAGAVYVYALEGTSFRKQAYLKASHVGSRFFFGSDLGFSNDGTALAIGSPGEVAVPSCSMYSGCPYYGAAYVFAFDAQGWKESQRLVQGVAPRERATFGSSIALDASGSTLVVGDRARGEQQAGAVDVFE